MSQLALTNADRRNSLQRFGYTDREAHFLCLAALHGGYFLRRQYASFLGTQDGGNVTQLVEKVLDLGHAEADTYKANTHIYHLASRRFYAALSQEDNRNRRRKELLTIKTKLMALDFVLAHQDQEYLATEPEKRALFKDIFNLKSDVLPAKHYASRGQLTDRYFVEKYPIFYSPSLQPAGPPIVSFCFVDPGLANVSGFETFLGRYAGLFSFLREFCVIYVADRDALFAKVRTTFDRFATDGWAGLNGTCFDGPIEKILEYFEARRLFEAKQFASFDRSKLLHFRDQQEKYTGSKIEALYERWKSGGDISSPASLSAKQDLQSSHSGRFSTYLLEYSYDLFGSITSR
ncbi:MAG: hypothetical protein C5B51_32330 [Terriglobia bacterium]|nr:MAG: hypothetical protein C5B51_32330 [Terriglobia bacterium]